MTDRVVHFEIPADNVKRAQEFYTKAFGWKMNPIPQMGYTLVGTAPSDKNGTPKEPGAINGGMPKRANPVKTTVVTIQVSDINEALAKIKKLGGSVVRKKSAAGDMGFTAYFKDSEGNVVGLWQNPGS